MTTTNPEADRFISRAKRWKKEFEALRAIALDCGLSEEVKWGKPCYTFQDGNIVIIQGFKEYCALMFFKGALLKDPGGILETPGQHQSGRQIRFTDVGEIVELKPVVRDYIREAIEVEKAGLKVKLKKTSDLTIPEEFQSRLDESPRLKTAFDALTPGRQRGYIFYVSSAKRSSTRKSRVETCVPRILDGKGLSD